MLESLYSLKRVQSSTLAVYISTTTFTFDSHRHSLNIRQIRVCFVMFRCKFSSTAEKVQVQVKNQETYKIHKKVHHTSFILCVCVCVYVLAYVCVCVCVCVLYLWILTEDPVVCFQCKCLLSLLLNGSSDINKLH